mmetsp:Transcript_114366/g.363426  ORF Transcript_114366/g.363426 Transcript_114366/m.363426 type:complete len:253 (+) Transcript_114366:1055-1813(+)
MASGFESKALRRACVQSGSRRFLHMMLMCSTSCPPNICLMVAPPQMGSISNTLGYCMVKTRSIPCFTVSNNTGNRRPTPSGESRCGEVTEDQSPWMVTSNDCREVSGNRCAAGCRGPSTAQYRRCETRPISRTTSMEVTSSRMLAISLGSSRDVSNSRGRRFAEYDNISSRISAKVAETGFEAPTRRSSGTRRGGPSSVTSHGEGAVAAGAPAPSGPAVAAAAAGGEAFASKARLQENGKRYFRCNSWSSNR